jgi:hypothetical protein
MWQNTVKGGGGGASLSIGSAKWETFSNSGYSPVTISGLTGKARAFSFAAYYNNNAFLITWNAADGANGTWNDETSGAGITTVSSVTDTSITFVVPTSINLAWKGWIFY